MGICPKKKSSGRIIDFPGTFPDFLLMCDKEVVEV